MSSPQDAPKPTSSGLRTELFQKSSSTEHDVDLSEEGRKDVSILVAEDKLAFSTLFLLLMANGW